MKVAPLAVWFVVALAVAGCGGAQTTEEASPVVSVAPDDLVLRDVRKDAARRMACQVPMIQVQVGPWAGAAGNVTAFGCGYQITYYLRCVASSQCQISPTG